jgi:hypothetical protein
MTEKRFRRAAFTVTAAAAAVIGLFLAKVEADTAAMPSINLPNPYAAGIKFGQMPEGRQWGGVIAVTPDRDGGSIWAFERCGAPSPPAPSRYASARFRAPPAITGASRLGQTHCPGHRDRGD